MADTIFWENDRVMLLDQTKLPVEQVYLACEDYRAVAAAIQGMVVRGAPAIGVAAAMGIALGALRIKAGGYPMISGGSSRKYAAISPKPGPPRSTSSGPLII